MTETIVNVEHLCLAYGSLKAVQDVTFSLQAGEVLAVIGQNGSGKTSTVECLEGLRKPDSGLIRIFNQDPWISRSEVYKKMGVQLQETDYFSKIKVSELCELFASFYEKPVDWKLLLNQMDLSEKKKRFIHQLSGGEKQRLSIILALMGRPQLLVLDEVTTGLDPEIRQKIRMGLDHLRKSGTTIIMVSHYLDEVEILADQILYLDKGKQAYYGSLPDFRTYAKRNISKEQWKENLSLEELYLMLVPKTSGFTLGGENDETLCGVM